MKPSESWQPEPLYMGDDAETAVEIAEKKGMSAQQVRVYAKRFVESGVWKEVTVKRAGKRNSEKAYIVVNPPETFYDAEPPEDEKV